MQLYANIRWFSTLQKFCLLLRIIVHKLFTDYNFYMPSLKFVYFVQIGSSSSVSCMDTLLGTDLPKDIFSVLLSPYCLMYH